MAIKFKRTFPHEIDYEDEKITFNLRRLDSKQWAEFSKGFRACLNSPQMRLMNRGRADQQEKDDEGAYTLNDKQVIAQNVIALASEAKAEFKREVDEYETMAAEFLEQVVTDYVTLEKGQIVIEEENGDERHVTEGKDLGLIFGGQPSILQGIMWAFWREHSLTTSTKNGLSSQSDSLISLDTRKEVGATQELTAEPAEDKASASPEVASVPSPTPSG